MANRNPSDDIIVEVDEEEEEESEESEESEEDEDEDYVPLVRTRSIQNAPQPIAVEEQQQNGEEEDDDDEDQASVLQMSTDAEQIGGEKEKGEVYVDPESGTDSDCSICPICLSPWWSVGDHRICSLLCGHLYGRSCIEKWIRRCGKSTGKCPQCNRKCKLTDIRTIYVPRIVVVDNDLQKEVESLRAENESLKFVKNTLLKEIAQHKKACLEHVSLGGMWRRPSEYADESSDSQAQVSLEHSFSLQNSDRGSSNCSFVLKGEFPVDGARVLDMDISNQILIVSRRPSGTGGTQLLTKISLLSPNDKEDIQLLPGTKAVRDLHISPSTDKLVLLASLGKKLSIVSKQTNNVVLSYDVLGPAWSCSWDFSCSYNVYAGLQNGMLLMFDIRQTGGPMESVGGLTHHLIHTIYPLVHNGVPSLPNGVKTVLSASSVGPCLWNIGGAGERSLLIPETEDQGVCISLAYSSSSDDIVASYRPRAHISNDTVGSQPSVSPSPTFPGSTILGSHVLIKRVGDGDYQSCASQPGNVSEVRMPKSAIVNTGYNSSLFAYGDEMTHGLCVRDLPSLRAVHNLKRLQHPILDVKYGRASDAGLLGCTSENTVQIFTCSGREV